MQKINGHEVKFTNLNKIYWPKEKITKRDMLNYYHQVAAYILPYLKNRPQSMNRHPNGIDGKSFYFKDVTGTAPDWIETFDIRTVNIQIKAIVSKTGDIKGYILVFKNTNKKIIIMHLLSTVYFMLCVKIKFHLI